MHKFNVGDYIRNEEGDKAFLIVNIVNGCYVLMSLSGNKTTYNTYFENIDREYIFIGKK